MLLLCLLSPQPSPANPDPSYINRWPVPRASSVASVKLEGCAIDESRCEVTPRDVKCREWYKTVLYFPCQVDYPSSHYPEWALESPYFFWYPSLFLPTLPPHSSPQSQRILSTLMPILPHPRTHGFWVYPGGEILILGL